MKKGNLSWLKTLILAFIIAIAIRTFVFTPVTVVGQSMYPNLHSADHLILNKFIYDFTEPDRFDIVVFHATKEEDYVKRVIGLPGDKISYHDDKLYVNGKAVPEPYLDKLKKQTPGLFTNNFSTVTVPDDQLFVMGDNRPISNDSRMFGTISEDKVIGKAMFCYWPTDDIQWLGSSE